MVAFPPAIKTQNRARLQRQLRNLPSPGGWAARACQQRENRVLCACRVPAFSTPFIRGIPPANLRLLARRCHCGMDRAPHARPSSPPTTESMPNESSSRWVNHTVTPDEAGRTVQQVLTGPMGVSRRMIQRLTRARGLQHNRRPAWLLAKVRAGDVVSARLRDNGRDIPVAVAQSWLEPGEVRRGPLPCRLGALRAMRSLPVVVRDGEEWVC